ncbi:hypothetical protein [Mycobacterium sp.]|uniref:hypothetical protein n=1 Tax=Mycobacterium sp. TaxID=1785 RepID=UPI003F990CEB
MVGVVVGCEKTTGGSATPSSPTASSTTPASVSASVSGAPQPSSDPAEPVPGVVTTLPDHSPPNALACFPSPTGSGRLTVAGVPDRAAPRLTVKPAGRLELGCGHR